jgi:hypothetical protein
VVYLKTLIFQIIESRGFANPLFSNCYTVMFFAIPSSFQMLDRRVFENPASFEFIDNRVLENLARVQILDSHVIENPTFSNSRQLCI